MNEERANALLLLAEQAEGGAVEAAKFDRLDAEREQLFTALSWFLEHRNLEYALRLCVALYSFWLTRGHIAEGREWLRKALAIPGAPAPLRAKALHRAGMLAFRSGDEAAARASFDESVKIARQLGDKGQVATSLLGLGRLVALRQGDHAAGHQLFEESLILARDLRNTQVEANAIHCLAALARLEGDREQAIRLYEQSLSLRRELGDDGGVAMEQLNLGFMTYHRGDTDHAARLFGESLRSSHKRGDMYTVPPCLVGFAGIAVKAGDATRAARILGAADVLITNAGLVLDPDDRAEYDRIAGAVRTALGDEAMKAQWTTGSAMNAAQAVAYALQGAGGGTAARPGR